MLVKKEISLGNLGSMVVVLISAAIAWGTMSARVESGEVKTKDLERKVEKTNEDIVDLKGTVGRMDERTKGLEKSMEKQEKLLLEIYSKVK